MSGFIYFIKKCIRLVKQEINKIAVANSYIQKFQLDYPKGETKYTEIYNVLSSLNTMADNLKKSLKDKWDMQENQREIIESVTHDIRTPITLIKGNLELLKEDEDNRECYISDIEKGVTRLEIYIKKLRDYSERARSLKTEVNEETLLYWITNIEAICSANDRKLYVKKKDLSSIMLSREGIDSEILKNADEKYITSKSSEDEVHVLGFYIVANIVKKSNGRLEISNYKDGDIFGAEVKIIFNKN